MKKLVIAMLLAGVTLGLTACGEKKAEPPKASAVAVPPPVAVASGSDAVQGVKNMNQDNGGERWEKLTENTNGVIYVNPNSLDKTEKSVTAKLEFYDGRKSITTFKTDCKSRFKSASAVLFNKNGNIIATGNDTGWKTIDLSTKVVDVVNYICK